MSRRHDSFADEMARKANVDLNGHLNGNAFEPTTPNRTDQGNAMRLVERHGNDLRYVYKWGKWLVWDSKRWRPDDTGEVVRRAKETVHAMFHEAGGGAGPIDKELTKHAMRSESKGSIEAMIALAQSEAGIPVRPEELDADPLLLNAANGTIDLQTGELREHRREDLITKLTPDYDLEAEAPTFAAFLERILPTKALRRFVQRVVGYAATGEISEEVLVILHGVGANGKSTLVNVVMEALGDYAMQAAPNLLLAKSSSHPTELADLFGARFVASVETDEGRRFAEGLVKQLTGRDPIKARRMREDFWQFNPTHTVFLATNHRPEVRGTDYAIWRRIKLVPFDTTIPEAEQDKQLPAKLRAELPGILAWIVRGCLDYQREGLGEPEEVKAATASYRTDMDVLAAFIEDSCVVREEVWVKFSELYGAYQSWCSESGETAKPKRSFGTLLKERGFEADRGTGNAPIRRGIALREDRNPGPEDGSKMKKGGDSYHSEEGPDSDTYAENTENSYRRYPRVGINGGGSFHEGSYRSKGNYGNYGNSVAQKEAEESKEDDVVGTQPDNPTFAAGSSARGESGSEHDVVASGRRLTSEEQREWERLKYGEGMSAKEARRVVLAKRATRQRGGDDNAEVVI